jgi:hypothetical protein
LAGGLVLKVRTVDGVLIALAVFPLASLPLAIFPLGSLPLAVFPLASLPLAVFTLASLPLAVFILASLPLAVDLPLFLSIVLLVVRHGGRDGEKHGQEDRKQQISQERARHDSIFLR